MDDGNDKQWASKYLLDPLTAPEPSQETGPGAQFGSTFGPREATTQRSPPMASPPPQKRSSVLVKKASSSSKRNSYPTPPQSASPRNENFPRYQDIPPVSDSAPPPSNVKQSPKSSMQTSESGRRRGSSLTERYPGDRSHRPLDMLREHEKAAHRAPHLRKKHYVGPDTIDDLDNVGGKYHHEGPFDATYYARNTSSTSSPLEALKASNEEALKATPKEKIMDSLERHRPLDGVAQVPPGVRDREGNVYYYEEGTDMMIEDGGNYKRWDGIKYLPEDLKGKGEPSYSIEKALKEHKEHRRVLSDGIEMTSRPHSSGSEARRGSGAEGVTDKETDLQRRNTTGRKISGGSIRRRLGSLRGKKNTD